MTLDELYEHVYDLLSLIFTAEELTVKLFQSDTGLALPVTDDPYIVIGYTPTILKKTGASTSGDIHDPSTEDPPLVDLPYLVRFTPYEGEVEIRQVNGDGEFLKIVLSALETVYVTEFLSALGLGIKDVEIPITSIPFRINNKPHKESIVSPVFSFYDSMREELPWIEDVNIAGAIDNEDGSETRILEITKDSVTP